MRWNLLPLMFGGLLSSCSSRAEPGRIQPAIDDGGGHMVAASFYGESFAGERTASGEPFDPNDFTAAHRTLPFGSRLRVTNPQNGRSVTVRVNDRGPFVQGRDLDISRAAAEAIGISGQGVAEVRIEKDGEEARKRAAVDSSGS